MIESARVPKACRKTAVAARRVALHALGIVLVRFVELHLERSAGVPGIEANDIELAAAQLMNEPRRHRVGLDSDARILSRMPLDDLLDLLRVR
jgi:hypothetical protein